MSETHGIRHGEMSQFKLAYNSAQQEIASTSRRGIASVLASLLVLLLCAAPARSQSSWYVDDDAPLDGDGTTWLSAFQYLQDGLAAAEPGDVIRVAAGVYKPDRDAGHPAGTGDRAASFQLRTGLALNGGYRGAYDGSGLPPDDRDLDAFEAVLSGDLLDNDGSEWTNYEENSFHVLVSSAVDGTAILDGFTVRSGNANDQEMPHDAGGGMRNEGGGTPTLVDCTFIYNRSFWGGAMENHGSSPTITRCRFNHNYGDNGGAINTLTGHPALSDCEFTSNSSFFWGGAMFNRGQSNPVIERCVFSENTGERGGAIGNEDGEATVRDCVFSGNAAAGSGGALASLRASLVLERCSFVENDSGSEGGAMVNWEQSNPHFTDCEFIGNHTGSWGGAFDNYNASSPLFENCIFTGNTTNGQGGAVHNHTDSCATLIDCAFNENHANNDGGALCAYIGSDVILIRCTFRDNSTDDDGGAIDVDRANPRIMDCVFVGNTAQDGGAIYFLNSLSTLIHCKFAQNAAENTGGALRAYGASVDAIGCLWNNNTAVRGGAFHNGASSFATLVNCTVYGNSATIAGGGLACMNGSIPTLRNCILWLNQDTEGFDESAQIHMGTTLIPDIAHTCLQGWTGTWGGLGNHGADPLFFDADGPDGMPGTEDDDLRLSIDSTCIDAGDNLALPADIYDLDEDGDTVESLPVDLLLQPRLIDDITMPDSGAGTAPLVDLGACEFQPCIGDVDGNRVVYLPDLAALLAAYWNCANDPGYLRTADLDGDNCIDLTDLSTLLAYYGTHCD